MGTEALRPSPDQARAQHGLRSLQAVPAHAPKRRFPWTPRLRGPEAGKTRAQLARSKRRPATAPPCVTNGPAIVCGSALKMRSERSEESESLGQLRAGTRVHVCRAEPSTTTGALRVQVVLGSPASNSPSAAPRPKQAWITAVKADGSVLLREDVHFGQHLQRLSDAHWKQALALVTPQFDASQHCFTTQRRAQAQSRATPVASPSAAGGGASPGQSPVERLQGSASKLKAVNALKVRGELYTDDVLARMNAMLGGAGEPDEQASREA